jgi:YVTN family beta-propeller protein
MIYVADNFSDTVSVIDGKTNKVLSDITGAGSNPNGIAVDPDSNLIYVTNSNSSTVSVIDGTTNKVVKTIDVGSNPIDVAINPGTGLIYVTNSNSSTVSVIDEIPPILKRFLHQFR